MRSGPGFGEDLRNIGLITLAAAVGVTATAGFLLARGAPGPAPVADAATPVVSSMIHVQMVAPRPTATVWVTGLSARPHAEARVVLEKVEVRALERAREAVATAEARAGRIERD
jgi:acyl dehydratase